MRWLRLDQARRFSEKPPAVQLLTPVTEGRIVSKLRWLFAIGLICGGACFGPADQIIGPANAQGTNAATASEVQVDLLRGLADIFSHGMDTLADRLGRLGYSAQVYSTHGWQSVAQRIAYKYSRGHKDIVVVIGHSLGANATFDVANALDRQNIPVELIVTFDATSPQPVPKNVLHFVNFYQENGFGKRVSPGPGFQGELTNIDLTADMGLSHTTIEKSPRLHAVVMQKIAAVVKKDLAKRMAASRAKPNPRKSKPVTGRGEPPAEDRPTTRCHHRDMHERKLGALADACGR
jgi:Thioesterase domain